MVYECSNEYLSYINIYIVSIPYKWGTGSALMIGDRVSSEKCVGEPSVILVFYFTVLKKKECYVLKKHSIINISVSILLMFNFRIGSTNDKRVGQLKRPFKEKLLILYIFQNY